MSIFRKKHLLYPKQDTDIYASHFTKEAKLNQLLYTSSKLSDWGSGIIVINIQIIGKYYLIVLIGYLLILILM